MRHKHGGNLRGLCGSLVDFSANINPLGMPEAVRDAAVRAVAEGERYPDPDCTALKAAIAAHEGISEDMLLCGNGAADLIYRFAYAVRAREGLVCAPTFAEYADAMRAAGCAVRTHLLREEDDFRLTEAILPELDGVQALYLCDPNNPTGRVISPDLLRRILAICEEKGIFVLLDECFMDFVTDERMRHTMMDKLAQHPNLVVLKAFTKLYAMPGLRLGYAASANAGLLSKMALAGQPWSVSNIAQAAGIAALGAKDFVSQTRTYINREQWFLAAELTKLGYKPLGDANYFLLKARPDMVQLLLKEGIAVRDCANFEGLGPGWIRVAVRTHEENEKLLAAMARCTHG